MDWINYEKQKPSQSDYYLCYIWGFSMNDYGNRSEFRVCYFNGNEFERYPICEIYKEKIVEYHKVIYWTKLIQPPINGELYNVLEEHVKEVKNIKH